MHLRRRTTAGLATGLAALATFGAALPSGAAETDLTLTLTNSGILSVSAPATASATAEVATVTTDAVIDVAGIVVTDERTSPGLFTVTAQSTDLASGDNTIPAASMLWTTTAVSGDLAVPAAGTMEVPTVVATGPGFGLGAASYDISGTITIPIVDAQPGEYTGTMTTSVN